MEIKLIREGQEGFGLLVEKDSGILSYDITENNKTLFENFDVEKLKASDGHFYIDCKLQEADVLNRNGRVYPKNILDKQIKIYQKLIDDYAALNEVDHPESSTISLSNISHRIHKVWWEGNVLYGTLDIIVSDSFLNQGIGWAIGDKIALYLKRKLKLGISSRGLGSVKSIGGKNIVQDDFELICFDLVATPSTPNAYLFIDTSNSINENTIVSLDEVYDNKKYDNIIKNILNT